MDAKLNLRGPGLWTHTQNWMMEYTGPKRESNFNPSHFFCQDTSSPRPTPRYQREEYNSLTHHIRHYGNPVHVQSAATSPGPMLDPLETFRLTQTERNLLESLVPEHNLEPGDDSMNRDQSAARSHHARYTTRKNTSNQNHASKRETSWGEDPNKHDQDRRWEVPGIAVPYLADSDSEQEDWSTREESTSP